MSIEQRMEKLEYYCSLMLDMIAPETRPFYALVIRHGLTKEEVEHTLRLCEQLSEQYKQQKRKDSSFSPRFFTNLRVRFIRTFHLLRRSTR